MGVVDVRYTVQVHLYTVSEKHQVDTWDYCREKPKLRIFRSVMVRRNQKDMSDLNKTIYKIEKAELQISEDEINLLYAPKKLSPTEKLELISLVYQLSIAIYNLYAKDHE